MILNPALKPATERLAAQFHERNPVRHVVIEAADVEELRVLLECRDQHNQRLCHNVTAPTAQSRCRTFC